MTVDKPSMRHPHGRQAPAQLLHVLQFASPDALISALEALNWPLDQADDSGLTLLFRAVLLGQLDHAEVLLSTGANIDCQDSNGWTPLFWAAYNQKIDVTRFLLCGGAQLQLNGANPLLTDANGKDVFGWQHRWAGNRCRRGCWRSGRSAEPIDTKQ